MSRTTILRAELASLRDTTYRRLPGLRVGSEEAALEHIDRVGFAFLFGDRGTEIPTLWEAVAGPRRVPNSHHDADIGRVWTWKDTLPTKGLIHYGKLLRGKPTLVSLALLPHFYALSPNYGDPDDYILQYEEGRLSVEAKSVYEVLLKEGGMATSRLRQLAGLSGGGDSARRFERAITELQTELKIAKVGISDSNRWGYAYVYDLFVRRYPNVPDRARAITTDEAMVTLLTRYLQNVVAVEARTAQNLFRWDGWEWGRALEIMAERGTLDREVRIEGARGPCLALAAPA